MKYNYYSSWIFWIKLKREGNKTRTHATVTLSLSLSLSRHDPSQGGPHNEPPTPHFTRGPDHDSFIHFFSSLLRFQFPKPLPHSLTTVFSMASNRNGVQRGSAKFDRPLKPRPRPSSPSPGSALRRANPAARNADAGQSFSQP